MSIISKAEPNSRQLMMGNEAIARGALEAGVRFVAAYPGTPSSEIPKVLGEVANERDIYVEWSANEKVSMEVAASGSLAGLRSLCAMKQVGVNVASDFLLHLVQYGTRAGMVLVTAEDPGALSSSNEGDSRPYCKMMEFPLIEPGSIQEAKEMTKWAFELSEEIHNLVMLRSVTRMSHASGLVIPGDLPELKNIKAEFRHDGDFMDQQTGPFMTFTPIVGPQRLRQRAALAKAVELFEESPFNTYSGPSKPELLIITSSAATLYCAEAVDILNIKDKVGILKLGTTWPLPPKLLEKHLATTGRVLVVEEGTPFLEDNIKALYAETVHRLGRIEFFGRKFGPLPAVGEFNPDIVMNALIELLDLPVQKALDNYRQDIGKLIPTTVPDRGLTFCAGCPHRASYYLLHEALTLDNRRGFVCGDIGCNAMGAADCGFSVVKTMAAMGSGIGMASGFGKMRRFGLNQPIMSVCGDSTFFHAVMPGLVNAIHNQVDIIHIVMDNSGTAMTGFQPHPGTTKAADQSELFALDIGAICKSMGIRVEVEDPFDFESARKTIRELMEDTKGVKVLILKQSCALSPERKSQRLGNVSIDQENCLAESCGCNRMCTRVFNCPGLIWDPVSKKTSIDEFVCTGCGVCSLICPQNAIKFEKMD